MQTPARPRSSGLSVLLAVLLGPLLLAPTAPATAGDQPHRGDRTSVELAPTGSLLDDPRHGRAALRELGDDVAAAAARNDLRTGELRTLLRTDETAWIDTRGQVFYVDPATDAAAPTESAGTASAAAPLSETFALHSNPGAGLTILLDFDGANVSGALWNTQQGVLPADHPAWDPAADGPAFSDGERAMVQQVWAMVAEDYAPFDVDVTTEDPGAAGLVRSGPSDTVYGTRVLVTPSDDPFAKICSRSCGGVAYLGVFDLVGSTFQPAWVFPQALGDQPKSVAEAASHEAGHNLGLDHDGTATQGYYAGHGVWAPIMGVGYDRPVVQWSRGSYPGANNQQDDLQVVTGYLGARADEASGSATSPSVLPDGEAVIGTSDDVDAFLLGTCTGTSVVQVRPAATAPDLDVRAVLYDAAGTQRALAQPTSSFGDGTTAQGLGGSLTIPTQGDGWVLTVEGVGEGAWGSGGYDDYGSLGGYTVSAPGCNGEVAPGVPTAPTAASSDSAGRDTLTLRWNAPTNPGSGPVTGYVVSRSGSAASVTLPADARSHTFTGLTAGTSYQLSVRAVNATGAGPEATVSATTLPPLPAAPSVPRDVTGAHDPSTGALQVRWTEPASSGTQPISGYAVSLNGSPVGTIAATGRGVDITRPGGFGDGRYVVGVAAVNAVGSSPRVTATVTVGNPAFPGNDDVADAALLTGTAGSVAGNNSFASWDPRDPTPPGGVQGAGGYSVWYSWTPTDDGAATMRTSGGGSGRDTTLGVYTGVPGSLTRVAGADDTVGLHAQVSFDADAGTRYLVAVDGYGSEGGTGPFTLTWSQLVPSAPSAPGGVSVAAGGGRATVSWTPAEAHGSAVTDYLVDLSRGTDREVSGSARRIVLRNLQPGRYRVRVAARNALGDSPYSGWKRFRIR